MKQITIGILAHVDGGKTTLSESLLYKSGAIKKSGRVDNQDAYLDFDSQERKRGITIFSKQARFNYHNTTFTLLDTPGHSDFSCEMERCLQVLDYAILVVSASEGVQAHTKTIWSLLESYHIPTFVFINKMDIAHYSIDKIIDELNQLDNNFINFDKDLNQEEIAMCSDELLDKYLKDNNISSNDIANLIFNRKLFPCISGSALKNNNSEALLNALDLYTLEKEYPIDFGLKVFKISRDDKNAKLTHVLITGGSLKVKDELENHEKVDQIRIYNGKKYECVSVAKAGTICALKGINDLKINDSLGIENNNQKALIDTCMSCGLLLPDNVDTFDMYRKLLELEEEDPSLHLAYNKVHDEITVQIMGDIQIEILVNLIKERFGIDIEISEAKANYEETIKNTIECVGHYEPLKHYAEVHLLLEPLSKGSGVEVESKCPLDVLDINYQKQILNYLSENDHYGILTNSKLTDIKITLLTGKAHLKHTERGDFKEACKRAIRQGLRLNECILLEPIMSFYLEIDNEYMSKVLFDLDNMGGTYKVSNYENKVVIEGSASATKMYGYNSKVLSYTHGEGIFTTKFIGYEEAQDPDKIIKEINYDPDNDIDNPSYSVFCKNGAGFNVKYDEVSKYMHLPFIYEEKESSSTKSYRRNEISDEELNRVMNSIYKPKERYKEKEEKNEIKKEEKAKPIKHKKSLLVVDAYNVIYSWDNLKELAGEDLNHARDELIKILTNYQGTNNGKMIIVFDAYKVKENIGSKKEIGKVEIVYTKNGQSADTYIEKLVYDLKDKYTISVASSDSLIQNSILSSGAYRISSRELEIRINQAISNYENARSIHKANRPMSNLKELIDKKSEE